MRTKSFSTSSKARGRGRSTAKSSRSRPETSCTANPGTGTASATRATNRCGSSCSNFGRGLLQPDLGDVELRQRRGRGVLHPEAVDGLILHAELGERRDHARPAGVAELDLMAFAH